jgi:hypothetical protein
MVDYAYTTVTGKIKTLLEKARTVGIPPKVTIEWLRTLGFKSSNDKTLLGVLKFIGFADSNGIPTQFWTAYRGAKHKTVLGEAIRKGYSDLFAVYPDANLRSQTELNHVFSTSSSGGAQVISRTIQTFKALVEEAEFPSSSEPTETSMPAGPLHTPPAEGAKVSPRTASGPEVHIDIQIHISPESSSDQIDKIFESMAKHLYGPGKAN